MLSSELIEYLQTFPGDPDVVLWKWQDGVYLQNDLRFSLQGTTCDLKLPLFIDEAVPTVYRNP